MNPTTLATGRGRHAAAPDVFAQFEEEHARRRAPLHLGGLGLPCITQALGEQPCRVCDRTPGRHTTGRHAATEPSLAALHAERVAFRDGPTVASHGHNPRHRGTDTEQVA